MPMDQKEYQKEILEQMAKNEEKLSELYAAYMHKFPTRSEFWRDIAQEEVSHGRWIRTLEMRVEEGGVMFSEKRFNIDALNDFYVFVQQQIARVKENDLPLIAALVVSKEIEESMLEKDFFRVFSGDSPELEILLLALEYSTKKHRDIVLKAWEEERKILTV